MSREVLLSKYKGCLLGAIFGDCLGAKFERDWRAIPYEKVTAYLESIKKKVKSNEKQKGKVKYTDDSCMTLDLAKSLVEKQDYDASDVVRNFSETYFRQTMGRSYGASVPLVFFTLKDQSYSGDVYKPAREQFDGSGSFGNGSAMRVSPVPLFHHGDIPNIVKLASDQSKLTHSHPLGINGAVLQSLAIEKALCSEKIDDPVLFCKELLNQLKEVAPVQDDLHVYEGQLNYIIRALKSKDLLKAEEINERIGSDVTAQKAVPAAIFSFLYTLNESRVPQLSKHNGLLRATIFAVGFSEDSDTVGSMAAAIAGAYYGVEMIPAEWKFACEGADQALEFAEKLLDLNDSCQRVE